jgi:hypothetical protein
VHHPVLPAGVRNQPAAQMFMWGSRSVPLNLQRPDTSVTSSAILHAPKRSLARPQCEGAVVKAVALDNSAMIAAFEPRKRF